MSIAYINGKFVDLDEEVLPIEERGHQFGDGVYEVVLVYDHKPCLLDEHLERLENSAKAIQLDLPYPIDKIKEIILEGLERSQLSDAQIYFQVTRGIASRIHAFPENVKPSFTMTIKPAREVDAKLYENGVDTLTTTDDRWKNCYIKSLNLLPNILAKQKAVNAEKFEAIFVDDNYVTEGSSTNVFVIKDGTLYTTPLTSNILPGITRSAVLNVAKEANIPVAEENFTVDFLKEGDEVFISSTTIEVLPVRSVDDVTIGEGKPGPITKQLHKLYVDTYTK